MFHDYLSKFEADDMREALLKLFKVLDTKIEDRDPYMKKDLSQFPYVNGGLFADENIEIPMLNEKVKEILLTVINYTEQLLLNLISLYNSYL